MGVWIADRFEVFETHLGGMSLVHVAQDHRAPAGRRVCALKTLRSDLTAQAVSLRRFTNEARLWVRLGSHPHVVSAFEVLEHDGWPYVVLELISGGDLRHWIGTPKLDLSHALRFGVQFCRGLIHAQGEGMSCHRDVKPANLMIGNDETLKITDFGLARVRDEILARGLVELDEPIPLDEPTEPRAIVWTDGEERGQGPSSTSNEAASPVVPKLVRDPEETTVEVPASRAGSLIGHDVRLAWPGEGSAGSRITKTGAMLGTVAYMAPEQFRDAGRVDIRADLYSFGVVLHEMIRGRRPFVGDTAGEIRKQHMEASPPSLASAIPRKHRGVAAQIDDIALQCLAKKPGDRFQSPLELGRALRSALKQVDPSAKA